MKNHLPEFAPRTCKYPWATWGNGQWHQLKQNDDFDCTMEVFRTTVLQRARKLGRTVQTRKISDTELAIRFVVVRKPRTAKKKK